MTSVSSTNSAALQILQQVGPVATFTRPGSAESDIVKIANGAPTVSSEPSKASTQAASAAGKFALDTAPEVGTNEGGYQRLSDDGGRSVRTATAAGSNPAVRPNEGGYQVSSDDGGLAARMAAASNAKPLIRSAKELTEMMDAFDALSAKFGLSPTHESIRSAILREGIW